MEIKKSPKANLENKKFFFREIGLIVTLALVFFAFEWKTHDKKSNSMGNQEALVVEAELIPITRETPPPPPEMPKEPTLADILDIVDDDIKIEHDLIINSEDNKNLGVDIRDFVYGTGTYVEEIEEDEINYLIVEEKPKFMGGDEDNFRAWVNDRLVYPPIAQENGVHGRVTLSFVVGVDGRLTDVTLVKGVDPALDKEAIRVVSSSPKWTPGRQRDRPVKVRYTFPIIFRLN